MFGMLGQGLPGYQHAEGLEVEIPDGAMVKDLFAILGISESQGAVAIVEGRMLKADDRMLPAVPVNVVQTVSGG